jgi:hypothetical protein
MQILNLRVKDGVHISTNQIREGLIQTFTRHATVLPQRAAEKKLISICR